MLKQAPRKYQPASLLAPLIDVFVLTLMLLLLRQPGFGLKSLPLPLLKEAGRTAARTTGEVSGQTVLLGGLISDNDQRSRSGVPGLTDIQIIGGLFGNTDNKRQRTEIIIFIRPQLVRNSVDARAVTEEFRDKLQSMKNKPSIVTGTTKLNGLDLDPPMSRP